jgi:putative PIN family toxin of toxin-antitoxin system
VSDLRVVFDCNVFAQALLSTAGPAAACVLAALDGTVVLCLSDFVISEIHDLADEPPLARMGITHERVNELLTKLLVLAEMMDQPPVVFEHPIDPKDGPYIDLAIAAGAAVITSRDKHLLNLMNASKPWSADFRARFPGLRIVSPEAFLKELRGLGAG